MTQTEAFISRSRKVLCARRSTLLASVVGLGFAVLAVGLGGYNPPNFQDWANPACAASGLAGSVPASDAPLRRIPEIFLNIESALMGSSYFDPRPLGARSRLAALGTLQAISYLRRK